FTNRKEKSIEDEATLDSNIERLSQLTYPECSHQIRDKIVCAQFVTALSDRFVRRTLQLKGISSLKMVVQRAMAVKVIQEKKPTDLPKIVVNDSSLEIVPHQLSFKNIKASTPIEEKIDDHNENNDNIENDESSQNNENDEDNDENNKYDESDVDDDDENANDKNINEKKKNRGKRDIEVRQTTLYESQPGEEPGKTTRRRTRKDNQQKKNKI
ncbi:hypothetical protein RF55_7192, partial [Lasius niger]